MLSWRIEAGLVLTVALSACGRHSADPRKSDVPAVRCAADQPTAAALVSGKDGAFWLEPVWVKGPDMADDNEMILRFYADAQKSRAASVNAVAFKTWMPEMGHPGPHKLLKISADLCNATVFHVTNLSLTMPGLWQLQMGATVNGKGDEASIEFRL